MHAVEFGREYIWKDPGKGKIVGVERSLELAEYTEIALPVCEHKPAAHRPGASSLNYLSPPTPPPPQGPRCTESPDWPCSCWSWLQVSSREFSEGGCFRPRPAQEKLQNPTQEIRKSANPAGEREVRCERHGENSHAQPSDVRF